MLCIGCTTVDSHDVVREGARSDALIALATYIAKSEGNQRYSVSPRTYCGNSEPCPAGDSLWGASTLQALLEALKATPAPDALRALLVSHKADMVLAFGPLDDLDPDSGAIIVRYEYPGGARVDRAHLHRDSGGWHVDRIEPLIIGTYVDTIISVR
jgi:hypothetical protein